MGAGGVICILGQFLLPCGKDKHALCGEAVNGRFQNSPVTCVTRQFRLSKKYVFLLKSKEGSMTVFQG